MGVEFWVPLGIIGIGAFHGLYCRFLEGVASRNEEKMGSMALGGLDKFCQVRLEHVKYGGCFTMTARFRKSRVSSEKIRQAVEKSVVCLLREYEALRMGVALSKTSWEDGKSRLLPEDIEISSRTAKQIVFASKNPNLALDLASNGGYLESVEEDDCLVMHGPLWRVGIVENGDDFDLVVFFAHVLVDGLGGAHLVGKLVQYMGDGEGAELESYKMNDAMERVLDVDLPLVHKMIMWLWFHWPLVFEIGFGGGERSKFFKGEKFDKERYDPLKAIPSSWIIDLDWNTTKKILDLAKVKGSSVHSVLCGFIAVAAAEAARIHEPEVSCPRVVCSHVVGLTKHTKVPVTGLRSYVGTTSTSHQIESFSKSFDGVVSDVSRHLSDPKTLIDSAKGTGGFFGIVSGPIEPVIDRMGRERTATLNMSNLGYNKDIPSKIIIDSEEILSRGAVFLQTSMMFGPSLMGVDIITTDTFLDEIPRTSNTIYITTSSSTTPLSLPRPKLVLHLYAPIPRVSASAHKAFVDALAELLRFAENAMP